MAADSVIVTQNLTNVTTTTPAATVTITEPVRNVTVIVQTTTVNE